MRKTQVLLGLLGASLLAGFGATVAAAPTPIGICGVTATTSARLTKDLNCTGDGIIVGAPGITIDLAGFTLKGDGGAGDYGIDNTAGHDDVTVKNGVVRNFETGIRATNAANGFRVLKVVASGNTNNGITITGDTARVQSSEASGNADAGILIDGDFARVQSSQASGNGSVGIFISGDSARVQSSQASGNDGGSGIDISGVSTRVQSCRASGNGLNGIRVGGGDATISGNRAKANGYFGGVSDGDGLGIRVDSITTGPVGSNIAAGNDNPDECEPAALCP